MSAKHINPIIKEVDPVNFLYFRTKTKLHELGRFVGVVARELYRDAVINDLEITGPVYWNYIGFENEQKPFTLEIALPVAEISSRYSGRFELKRSETFYCISVIHTGTWYDMPDTYGRLFQFAADKQLERVSQHREVYINMDFLNPAANVTEIQIGITGESFESLMQLTENANGYSHHSALLA